MFCFMCSAVQVHGHRQIIVVYVSRRIREIADLSLLFNFMPYKYLNIHHKLSVSLDVRFFIVIFLFISVVDPRGVIGK